MKQGYLTIVLMVALSSCDTTRWFQLYDVKCTNCQDTFGRLISARDSVFVEYNFWGRDGFMNFVVHNNTGKPIYIDWKRSGFYKNGVLYRYWEDVTKGTDIRQYVAPHGMVQNPRTYSTSRTYKPERVSFVINNSQYSPPFVYKVTNDNYHVLPENRMTSYKEDFNGEPHTVYVEGFKENESVLKMRNYIMWLYKENDEDGILIDNTFYLSSIQEFGDKHYYSKMLDANPPSNKFYKIIDKSEYSREGINRLSGMGFY